MNATLPKIIIAFRKLASTFVARSERGIAIFIAKEEGETEEGDYTPVEASITEVTDLTDLSGWSNANAARIGDMLAIKPAKSVVVTIDSTVGTVAEATALIEANYQNGRVTMIGTSTDYMALATWAKQKKSYHALVFDTTGHDSRYVENVYSQNIRFSDSWDAGRNGQGTLIRSTATTAEILPMLAAVLSKANVNGASSKVLNALESVTDVASPDTVINSGNIIVYNDWSDGERVVRLGTAVNTLVTFDNAEDGGDKIEDMRYIEISEAADMIRQDIISVYRDEYSGQKKNSVDNQMQLLGAIKDYYDRLAADDVLNNASENTADIDVESQRAAWVEVKPEAAGWNDNQVKAKPFQRNVYLKSNIQILHSMQNLYMDITLD